MDEKFREENENTAEVEIATDKNTATAASDITFEADIITVEQENNMMSASGNVRIMQKGDLLEADLISYNQITGVAKATGGVRLNERWHRTFVRGNDS